MPVTLMLVWAASCLWAICRVQRMEVALVSKVAWGAVILALPLLGLLAFLLLAEDTPRMERELGIRHI